MHGFCFTCWTQEVHLSLKVQKTNFISAAHLYFQNHSYSCHFGFVFRFANITTNHSTPNKRPSNLAIIIIPFIVPQSFFARLVKTMSLRFVCRFLSSMTETYHVKNKWTWRLQQFFINLYCSHSCNSMNGTYFIASELKLWYSMLLTIVISKNRMETII